ncbi:hypothetical protein GCM10023093_17380 [Nemorincola caseinilytica]|uniref:Uncharacterized protein n=1 Tax=Nemorincola caseinilytica TaxID=2054315 RepID=A0ABP8NG94_9BACT
MKDEQVKQKIESVDALAGGIVYGREEAWERLQARLDAPTRRVVAWRRYGVAAALLLCICTVALYLYFAPSKPKPLAAAPTVPATPIANTAPIPLPATTPTPIVTQETTGKKYVILPRPPLTVANEEVPQPAPAEVAAAPEPAPVASPAKKMRVLHLYDLDHDTGEPEETLVYNGPALDIKAMKVVSLYDVQREEEMRRKDEEIMTLVRISKPHSVLDIAGRLTRPRPLSDRLAPDPLTLRLGRKN